MRGAALDRHAFADAESRRAADGADHAPVVLSEADNGGIALRRLG